jgi:hypothetical protein
MFPVLFRLQYLGEIGQKELVKYEYVDVSRLLGIHTNFYFWGIRKVVVGLCEEQLVVYIIVVCSCPGFFFQLEHQRVCELYCSEISFLFSFLFLFLFLFFSFSFLFLSHFYLNLVYYSLAAAVFSLTLFSCHYFIFFRKY